MTKTYEDAEERFKSTDYISLDLLDEFKRYKSLLLVYGRVGTHEEIL